MFKENTIPELGDCCEVSPPVSSGAGASPVGVWRQVWVMQTELEGEVLNRGEKLHQDQEEG